MKDFKPCAVAVAFTARTFIAAVTIRLADLQLDYSGEPRDSFTRKRDAPFGGRCRKCRLAN